MITVTCPKCGAKNRIDEQQAMSMQPVCGRCRTKLDVSASNDGHPVTITDANFESLVLQSAQPVLVDCWAPWCGPCRAIAPVLAQLAAETAGRFVIGKLNIDENPATASDFNIGSIPTMLVFKNEPNVQGRIATFKAKWSVRYRESRDIQNMVAKNLSADVRKRLAEVAVRAYEAAGLRDYGRIDVRLAHDDAIYIVEANPNPYLAEGEDLAWAAEEAGHQYPDFIEKIAEMAISRHASRG